MSLVFKLEDFIVERSFGGSGNKANSDGSSLVALPS